MLESNVSNSETLSILVGSQPPAARKRNVAQGASKDDSGNEFEGVVLGPRQPNSIKLAAIKKCM
jgi:hypothetical protein